MGDATGSHIGPVKSRVGNDLLRARLKGRTSLAEAGVWPHRDNR